MTAVLSGFTGVEQALVDWLPAQRWFGGKGEAVRRVRLRPVAEFTDQLALGGPCGLLTVAEVLVGDQTQNYQLPLSVRAADDPLPGANPITRWGGFAIYDATADGQLIGELLALISTNSVRGAVAFRAEPSGGLALVRRRGLASRVGSAEQSNTSVVIGERFILKLFRRIQPGVNPDLELHRALGDVGGQHVAPLLGAIEGELDGAPVTFGMLHSFCADAVDGWRAATENIAALLAGEAPTGFTDSARSIGRAVASVHAGLADRLGSADLSAGQLSAISDGFLSRLSDTLRVMPGLRPYADCLRAAFTGITTLPAGPVPPRAQRVHGDLHLGQVLRTTTRWLLIDFEGEPAAPITERIGWHSPLRDVAGMLRSFDYAAHHSLISAGQVTPADARLAADWASGMREAFCAGYAETAGADPREYAALLLGYELDKAVYEVRYEAHNRPAWAAIPLGAIQRMTGTRTGAEAGNGAEGGKGPLS